MGSGGPPPPPPSPEVAQYTARLSTPLSPAVLTIATNLIDGLVAQASWTNLDVLTCPFLPMTQADALVNLRGPDFLVPAEVNSPQWDIKEGYLFNGTNNYVRSGFAPSGGGTNYQPNNSSFGIYVTAHPGASSTTAKSGCVDGTATTQMSHYPRFADADPRAQIQSSAQISNSFSGTNGVGFFVVNRSGSTAAQFFKNGVAGGTSGNLAGNRSTTEAYIGAFNNNGAAANFHNARYSAWLWSNSKNAAAWLAVYNLLSAAYAARQSA